MSELLTQSEVEESMESSSRASPLSKHSDAVQKLREKFESSDLNDTETPKRAWMSDSVFSKYRLDNFRTCSNNIKKEIAKQNEAKSSLNTMNSESGSSPKSLKTDDCEGTVGAHTPLNTKALLDTTFYPLYLVSQWQERGTTTARVTVAIIIQSGIGSDDFKIRIIEDGDVLELTVQWPKPLIDITFMHKNGCCLVNLETLHSQITILSFLDLKRL